jgi:hypothetical protein
VLSPIPIGSVVASVATERARWMVNPCPGSVCVASEKATVAPTARKGCPCAHAPTMVVFSVGPGNFGSFGFVRYASDPSLRCPPVTPGRDPSAIAPLLDLISGP